MQHIGHHWIPDIPSINTNIKDKDQEEDNGPSTTQPSTPPASAPLVAQPSTDDIETTTPDSTTSNPGNMEGLFSTLACFLGWGGNDDNRGQAEANIHHYDDPLIGCDDLFVCSSVLVGKTNHSTSDEDDNQSKWSFW